MAREGRARAEEEVPCPLSLLITSPRRQEGGPASMGKASPAAGEGERDAGPDAIEGEREQSPM